LRFTPDSATAVGSLPVAAVVNAVPGPDRAERDDNNRAIYRTVGDACGGPYTLGGQPPGP
jgi:hypothetical protein